MDYTSYEQFENGEEKLYVADWFYTKNQDSFYNGTGHLVATNTGFSKDWIVKETEKAVCVEFPLVNTRSYEDSVYTKKVWLPKSVVVTRVYTAAPDSLYDEVKYF